MDSRKPRADHPVNQERIRDFHRFVDEYLESKLEQGESGEIIFSLTTRYGLIQSIRGTTTAVLFAEQTRPARKDESQAG